MKDAGGTLDDELRAAVGEALGVEVVRSTRLHGGDVARSHRLDLADGRTVFAKTHADPPPEFFVTEAVGLHWLREGVAHGGGVARLAVPEVLAVGESPPFLALEWIEVGGRSDGTEEALGLGLAALHRAGSPTFGREDRRTTGSRGLPNDPADSWSEFYATRRLLPLADLAERASALPAPAIAALRSVAERLPSLVGPEEPPARLHGDLWGGNRLVDVHGRNWLIDPACFGGHREFDLAMMRLFGGFGAEAYEAYADAHPLADGWEDRVALHQIAPLVVHAIKFGGGYVASATAAIGRYS